MRIPLLEGVLVEDPPAAAGWLPATTPANAIAAASDAELLLLAVDRMASWRRGSLSSCCLEPNPLVNYNSSHLMWRNALGNTVMSARV